jgi:hypothetical protein
MRIGLILSLLLMSLSSFAADKTYYVRNKAEADTEKTIIVIKEIGAYRIFKACDLIAYLHNGSVDLDNEEECHSIGNGIYKYNSANLMSYKKELEEIAQKNANIDNALTLSSALAGAYTYGQFIYKFLGPNMIKDHAALATFRENKKTYILGTLFTVATGFLATVHDNVQEEHELLASVLETATQPIAPGTELKIDMPLSEFITHLNELLILGEEAGTFEALEI